MSEAVGEGEGACGGTHSARGGHALAHMMLNGAVPKWSSKLQAGHPVKQSTAHLVALAPHLGQHAALQVAAVPGGALQGGRGGQGSRAVLSTRAHFKAALSMQRPFHSWLSMQAGLRPGPFRTRPLQHAGNACPAPHLEAEAAVQEGCLGHAGSPPRADRRELEIVTAQHQLAGGNRGKQAEKGLDEAACTCRWGQGWRSTHRTGDPSTASRCSATHPPVPGQQNVAFEEREEKKDICTCRPPKGASRPRMERHMASIMWKNSAASYWK